MANMPVVFAMGTKASINQEKVSNGQILISPEQGKVFIDKNSSRYEITKSPKKQIVVSNIMKPGVDLVINTNTDLATAIKSYLNLDQFHSAPLENYKLFLLQGVYKLETSLQIKRSTIEGENRDNTILICSKGSLYISGGNSFEVKNLTLQKDNAETNSVYGISCSGESAINGIIDNICFKNLTYGIYLINHFGNKITRCIFNNCYYGVYSSIGSGEGSIVEGCSFNNCTQGITGTDVGGKDTYTANTFKGCSTAIKVTGPYIVNGNSIDIVTSQTISPDTSIIGIQCGKYSVITGNRIKVNNSGNNFIGILVDGQYCTIQGNTIFTPRSIPYIGIQLTNNAEGASITGNSINNIQSASYYGKGIEIPTKKKEDDPDIIVQAISITGNTINNFDIGIDFNGHGCAISNNTISYCDQCILLSNTSTNNIVSNNINFYSNNSININNQGTAILNNIIIANRCYLTGAINALSDYNIIEYNYNK